MHINKKYGFTLIELIIVILIIGILAAISAPMMQSIKPRAMCAEMVAAMGTIRSAVRQYYMEYNEIPPIWGGSPLNDPDTANEFLKAGLNVDDLRGQYSSKECYNIYVVASPTEPGAVVEYYPRGVVNPNDGYKHTEAETLLDPGQNWNCLYMNIRDGSIYQVGMPQSGYPEE